jgi:hypothetical protein
LGTVAGHADNGRMVWLIWSVVAAVALATAALWWRALF